MVVAVHDLVFGGRRCAHEVGSIMENDAMVDVYRRLVRAEEEGEEPHPGKGRPGHAGEILEVDLGDERHLATDELRRGGRACANRRPPRAARKVRVTADARHSHAARLDGLELGAQGGANTHAKFLGDVREPELGDFFDEQRFHARMELSHRLDLPTDSGCTFRAVPRARSRKPRRGQRDGVGSLAPGRTCRKSSTRTERTTASPTDCTIPTGISTAPA